MLFITEIRDTKKISAIQERKLFIVRRIFNSFRRKIKIKDGKRMLKNLRMKGC